eukprot:15454734-Alexandrium_andersonii.AAC.1
MSLPGTRLPTAPEETSSQETDAASAAPSDEARPAMPLSGPRPPRQGDEAERAEYLRAQLREARRMQAPVTPKRKARAEEVKEGPGAEQDTPDQPPTLDGDHWGDDHWRAAEWDDQWGQREGEYWGPSWWGNDDTDP